ncbi:MAG TPA: ABC-three component system protein [Rhizomicrobium sp.]|nr:ABC-three component system protein [Rhizomicrobium sp.]
MAEIDAITPEQRLWYKLSFELKVSRSYGIQFQDFFSTVMEKYHGTDFVRIRAFGSLGDKGCDGYVQSTGATYQCFGKSHDSSVNVQKLVDKVGDDYATAATHLNSIMKEWHFAHNLVDGLPVNVVQKIELLRSDNPHHKFGLIGPSGLEVLVLQLSPDDLHPLLGPAATAEDTRNLQLEEVRDLIQNLMAKIDAKPNISGPITPVPTTKLEFNKLPAHWVGLIRLGMQNAGYVQQYIDEHRDPEVGERLAKIFGDQYRTLKLEGLAPVAIMNSLYERVTGVGSVTAQRQVAAQALLSHLFESCDIFEDKPFAR